MGEINNSQITVALCDQEVTGLRFGEIVVARGWVSEEVLETLIAQYEEIQERQQKRVETQSHRCGLSEAEAPLTGLRAIL